MALPVTGVVKLPGAKLTNSPLPISRDLLFRTWPLFIHADGQAAGALGAVRNTSQVKKYYPATNASNLFSVINLQANPALPKANALKGTVPAGSARGYNVPLSGYNGRNGYTIAALLYRQVGASGSVSYMQVGRYTAAGGQAAMLSLQMNGTGDVTLGFRRTTGDESFTSVIRGGSLGTWRPVLGTINLDTDQAYFESVDTGVNSFATIPAPTSEPYRYPNLSPLAFGWRVGARPSNNSGGDQMQDGYTRCLGVGPLLSAEGLDVVRSYLMAEYTAMSAFNP